MQTVAITANSPPVEIPLESVLCHDARDPIERGTVLARKGSRLHADEVAALLRRGLGELHLAVPAPDDLNEDEAAARLAVAIAGPGVRPGRALSGQVSFISDSRGMLRIDTAQVDRINAHDDVLLLTAEGERAVDAETTLGVVKCAPLFMSVHQVEAVENLADGYGPAMQLEPFRALSVAFIAPRERLRGSAFDRACAALSRALEWFGSSLQVVSAAEASGDGLVTAYRQALESNVDLVLVGGAAGTDPLDVVFDGLRQAGGGVEQMGIPAEPGTACWIGTLGSTPVLGLASCELFGQPGALDLLLPRLLTGEPLDRTLLRRLAYGGLLLGPPRIAPYHADHPTTDAVGGK
jgi:molybdenum cofactor cytidylyltransferase